MKRLLTVFGLVLAMTAVAPAVAFAGCGSKVARNTKTQPASGQQADVNGQSNSTDGSHRGFDRSKK